MPALLEKLMAQPELLSMLSDAFSSRSNAKSLGDTAIVQPAITLVSESVEIIVAPKEDMSTSLIKNIIKQDVKENPRTLMNKYPVYDVDPEEEERVNAMRQELVGKTITGTFFMKDQPPHVKHWIRWNEKKCDNVYIPRDLAFAVFGGQPKSGAKVKATISALGPDTATAWRKHPQCEAFEILPKISYMSPKYPRSLPSLSSFRTANTNSTMSSSPASNEVDSWLSSRKARMYSSVTGRSVSKQPAVPTMRTTCPNKVDWRARNQFASSINETEG